MHTMATSDSARLSEHSFSTNVMPRGFGDRSPTASPATRHASSHLSAAELGMVLGWFGVGIGVAELLMPGQFARAVGLPGRVRLMQAMGVREVATGAGVLLRPGKPGWWWLRLAGDAIDLGLLAFASRDTHSRRTAWVAAGVTGVAVLELLAALDNQARRPLRATPGVLQVTTSLNIQRSPEECYRFWRNFDNFPRFMQHVQAVQVMDPTRSQWTVRAPLGPPLTWQAELSSDIPGRQLGWRTLPGSDIEHAGVVRFAPAIGARGTRVEVELHARAPLGNTGARLASLFGEAPSQQIDEDLRRFKQLIETGEVATTIGQPSGRRSPLTRLLHRGAPQ